MNLQSSPRKAANGRKDLRLPNPKGRLRDQFHEVARFRHFSLRTETEYWAWVVRYLKFHRDKAGECTQLGNRASRSCEIIIPNANGVPSSSPTLRQRRYVGFASWKVSTRNGLRQGKDATALALMWERIPKVGAGAPTLGFAHEAPLGLTVPVGQNV